MLMLSLQTLQKLHNRHVCMVRTRWLCQRFNLPFEKQSVTASSIVLQPGTLWAPRTKSDEVCPDFPSQRPGGSSRLVLCARRQAASAAAEARGQRPASKGERFERQSMAKALWASRGQGPRPTVARRSLLPHPDHATILTNSLALCLTVRSLRPSICNMRSLAPAWLSIAEREEFSCQAGVDNLVPPPYAASLQVPLLIEFRGRQSDVVRETLKLQVY